MLIELTWYFVLIKKVGKIYLLLDVLKCVVIQNWKWIIVQVGLKIIRKLFWEVQKITWVQ